MDIRNCKRCGKVFVKVGSSNLCPECLKADEEEFKKVRNYIYNNPGATVIEVSEKTEVPVSKIMEYLKDGRIELAKMDGLPILTCERCGAPIRSGRFCNQCAALLEKELKKVIPAKPVEKEESDRLLKDKKEKMYTADQLNKE